jgi:predicted PurR-regulated permease PerM
MTSLSTDALRWLKTGLWLPLIALNGWVVLQVFQYFEPLVTILIGASVLAFILNYPVEWLQSRLSRPVAVAIVLLVSLIALIGIGITIVPVLLEQFAAIVEQIPNGLAGAIAHLQVIQSWAAAYRLPINFDQVIQQITDRLPDQLEGLVAQPLLFTLNAVGGLSSVLLTSVLTFYLLLDGKRLWTAVFQRLPLKNRDRIRRSLQDDFHRYFIGQAILGAVMAVLLSVVLVILHIPYSLLLGAAVGVMTLIPFGDVAGYSLVCLLIAAQSPGLAVLTLGVIVVLDQLIDQAIAPRILGSFTGLSPIWIILALLLGTKLFGFPGLLLAVPIASFISTILEDETLLENQDSLIQVEDRTPNPFKPSIDESVKI